MQSLTPARRRLVRALTAVPAAIAGLLVWVVAVPIAGADLPFTDAAGREQEIGPAQIIMFSVLVSLAGWALLAILERFAPARALRIWTIVAVIVLVLSVAPLLSMEAGAIIALGAMHLAVGAVIIAVMRSTAPDRGSVDRVLTPAR